MSFWEDLSPGIKRYAMVAVVLLVVLLGYRQCASSTQSSGAAPQRGIVH